MAHPSNQIPPATEGHRIGELGDDAMLTSDGPAFPPYGPTREGDRPSPELHAERERRRSRFGDEFDDWRRSRKTDRRAPSGRSEPASSVEDVQQHFERS